MLPLTKELFQTGIFILPCLCSDLFLDISSPCFSRAEIPSLTQKTCFQNSEAMSSYAGLAAEVRTGNTWIIDLPSNTMLSTSLTEHVVTYSGQDEPVKSFYNHFTRVRCKTKDSPMNGEDALETISNKFLQKGSTRADVGV